MSGEWTIERAHRLLSHGYRLRAGDGSDTTIEMRADGSVLLDLAGVGFWAAVQTACFRLLLELPGSNEPEPTAWQSVLMLSAIVGSWTLTAWLWRQLRLRLAPPIRFSADGVALARWQEVGPWRWILTRADGAVLCRVRRRTRLAFLPRRQWRFELDGDVGRYQYELKRGRLPPPRIVAERFEVRLDGDRIRCSGGAGGPDEPRLGAYLGAFCLAVPHSLL